VARVCVARDCRRSGLDRQGFEPVSPRIVGEEAPDPGKLVVPANGRAGVGEPFGDRVQLVCGPAVQRTRDAPCGSG